MGSLAKIDERGRLVIPSDLRQSIKTDYLEVRAEGERLVLIPIPDPLNALRGKVSRARPLKDLSAAAEEEADRIVRKSRTHARS